MPDRELLAAASALLELCTRKKLTVATAESCTGGLVAAALSEIPGSSHMLDRGFVTYSNIAKQQVLGVAAETLRAHGAVSRQTAQEMARGAIAHSNADIAVAITGIAGPGGGSADKPVGLVHFAAAVRSGALTHKEMRYGDIGRANVRHASVRQALAMLQELAEKEEPPAGQN